jgi:uncharacterized protein (DUF2235 family)
MAKTIVVFSDGTGNSSAKLFKTNVWRLYQALDLAAPTPEQVASGVERQIAYYDDGVGTSSFKPLALLGGAFGWGLKRNILDLYRFLCRNYEPGDRIYAFGFSRGAFTIRMLIGLVVREGLIPRTTDEELDRHAKDAYRAYRRRYGERQIHLARPLRNLRDLAISCYRRIRKQETYDSVVKVMPNEIAFVGVWDTVAAYGMPVAELTRGIDKYVWPMSMPNYTLSPKVKTACHALALDDERDTFHPLLWDEVEEDKLVAKGETAAGRLRQVWFAGMHSDVGGGYPEDGLSYIPLDWMITEAAAAGLRFRPEAVAEVQRTARESGPMHDSRRGVGGYYRFQPRKLSARVDPPDPTTVIMRNPELHGRGLLTSVKIHDSVIERIGDRSHAYAPIVLPAEYRIARTGGALAPPAESNPGLRAARQEWVWNDVWRRRIAYFTMVGVSLLLVLLALRNAWRVPTACDGPLCLLAPLIDAIGAFLPGFLETWVRALARSPEWVAVGIAALSFLLIRSGGLATRIEDGMAELWAQSLGRPALAPVTAAGRSTGRPGDFAFRFRTGRFYLRTFQHLKWKSVPFVFGISLVAAITIAIVAIPTLTVYRVQLSWAEQSDRFCQRSGGAQARFETSAQCWFSGQAVTKGHRYRVVLTVSAPWFDDTIPARPEAPHVEQMSPLVRIIGAPFRRYLNEAWYQPMVRIVPTARDEPRETQALILRHCDCGRPVYSAEFVASRSGDVFFFVNDAILSWNGITDAFYGNNKGSAEIRIELAE